MIEPTITNARAPEPGSEESQTVTHKRARRRGCSRIARFGKPWGLRAQVVRELTLGARQRIGLEPWGRMKVKYQGLEPDLPTILELANKIDVKAETLAEGIASLLDSARARKILHDNVTKAFGRFWVDGSK